MSATFTVYSIASPRSCAIATGATTRLRYPARHQIGVRMSVLLEQQTARNHRCQQHARHEQPCEPVADVQGVANADTILDPHCRVARVEVKQAADFPRVVGCGISVKLLPRSRRDCALAALTDAEHPEGHAEIEQH